jgi:hypothetical protein
LILGIFRFLKGGALKPYIYVLLIMLLSLSLYCYLHPNLRYLLGLAWDCGGVTTGPVTVPLVLALGIGISHVANKGGDNTEGGFGVVTLASLVPVITVLLLGLFTAAKVPLPSNDIDFFAPTNTQSQFLFESETQMKDYALAKASYSAQMQAFGSDQDSLMSYVEMLGADDARVKKVFGSHDHFRTWLIRNGSEDLKSHFSGLLTSLEADKEAGALDDMNPGAYIRRNVVAALRAIVPLSLFLLGVLYLILRERLGRSDEIFLGLFFAILGMAIFGGGIELGLSKIGDGEYLRAKTDPEL